MDATLAAKDAVLSDMRETKAYHYDLYERLGRLPALFIQSPELAKREAVALSDIEHAFTGDCRATSALSDLLDPNGEEFERQNELRYEVTGLRPPPPVPGGVVPLSRLAELVNLDEHEYALLGTMKVGDSFNFDEVTIKRVS